MAGIYVHIPFCKSRCIYCDFFSTTDLAYADRYIRAVAAEARLRRGELGDEPVRTLYWGGGTPSQLSLNRLTALRASLAEVFSLADVQEFTVEVNPDDVTAELAATLRQMGVNRVSMGVQSFVDAELRFMQRRHDAEGARRAVSLLRQAGIANISIDLIYGIPGQTMASWQYSLREALALHPQHISAYSLTYEVRTHLWHMREKGEITELPEELCVEMFRTLIATLRAANYEHYEISNFALPNFYSRHNSAYWDGTPYLGLGAAAHSFDGNVRRANPTSLRRYFDAVEAGHTAFTEERVNRWEKYDEYVMLGLRTARGVDADRIRRDFGQEAYDHFAHGAKPHLADGLLRRDGARYTLTADGIMLADAVIRDLFY